MLNIFMNNMIKIYIKKMLFVMKQNKTNIIKKHICLYILCCDILFNLITLSYMKLSLLIVYQQLSSICWHLNLSISDLNRLILDYTERYIRIF